MSYAETLIPPQPAPRKVAKPITTARLAGYIFVAIWALFAALLVYTVINGWDLEKFTRYGPRYLHGLGITLSLVAISVVCGALLSLPLAMARLSSSRVLNWLAYGYIYFFRGTPLLAQLFLVYYGLGIFRPQLEAVGIWWFFRDAWYCGLFAMTINTAAYQAEILRGAIESVPHGQREAAAALGIHKFIAFRKIILPQALIVALRPYGNEIILLIKGSAVVAIITVLDLMGETRYAFSRTFDYQTYLWAAIFYLSIVEALRHLWAWIERRLTRHLKR
ncbi:polar amino acid transport system permease protein [Rhizobium leguminosarum]|uniref:Polar amino acid transport system permease protein n=1 Tax=Rhizobium leguminosarum TaxID=384 RepID=A0AAE2SVY9_RHILE|nr:MULTISPECIES: ABC transporter permease [Rhizobium]MBB4290037.1 polar amino acid transport system permease protein [Rhizobium leguminosarum]MBB4296681.1 polar amino acid transport system permease protein [Rhizobium leguminosarum]MBB4308059.1 polar amino acid transport system permease protein [Rhizobium leguminosarum]MBB4415894.1 polar amino acid transport system permease protein [Rhizobium leguminosarum]MBB4431140.1 polar amino acid transport system permease protein [Rhizobium esperanzae]